MGNIFYLTTLVILMAFSFICACHVGMLVSVSLECHPNFSGSHLVFPGSHLFSRASCQNISTLNGGSLKLVDKFTYLGSSVSFTEKDINIRLAKAWTAIDRLLIIWKSNLSDKIKRNFFQIAVVSILLCGCTTLNKSRKQHLTIHS